VTSVAHLNTAIFRYPDHRTIDPQPFVWTKNAKQIIEKIERGLRTL